MKNLLLALILLPFITGCSKDKVRNTNPYLPDYSFNLTINTNLASYSKLNFNMQPLYINDGTSGIKGIIVMKVSDTDFRAWEASCPNQYPSDCSTMVISGLNAKCNCEDAYEYNMFSGIGNNGASYTMIPYRVEVLGNNSIRVYN